ncbi:MAG: hypothetical protein LBH95_00315 [Oscillospiraceae bacterium]|nr:hypothetical protein [Oscillospiraceae bacterium]
MILEGSDPAALHRAALRLAAGWMWDERKVLAGLHVDVPVLDNGPDAVIKADDVRAIRRDSLLRPFDGEVKVYIIAYAHNMNASAQNALLRLLEEPPPYVRFVLLVRNAGMLLQTVRSRCAVYRCAAGEDGRGAAPDGIPPVSEEEWTRADAFLEALDDPWQRAAVVFSWDKLPRAALRGVLDAVMSRLRDCCLREGSKPLYTETLDTVSKLIPSLELNASPGSVCGVLAICPAGSRTG